MFCARVIAGFGSCASCIPRSGRWQEVSREKDVALRKHIQENESLNFRNQQVILRKWKRVQEQLRPLGRISFMILNSVFGEAMLAAIARPGSVYCYCHELN